MNRENALFDERVRPDQFQELAFGEQAPGISDQREQYVVRLGLERYDAAVLREPALRSVQGELPEFVCFAGHKS